MQQKIFQREQSFGHQRMVTFTPIQLTHGKEKKSKPTQIIYYVYCVSKFLLWHKISSSYSGLKFKLSQRHNVNFSQTLDIKLMKMLFKVQSQRKNWMLIFLLIGIIHVTQVCWCLFVSFCLDFMFEEFGWFLLLC